MHARNVTKLATTRLAESYDSRQQAHNNFATGVYKYHMRTICLD